MWVKYSTDLVEDDYSFNLACSLQTESRVEAAGFISLLVAFALVKGDDTGQVDHLTDKAIEQGCYWHGARGELVKAFCDSGVLVGSRDDDTSPLTVAPALWATLAGPVLKGREEARKRKKEQRNRRKK